MAGSGAPALGNTASAATISPEAQPEIIKHECFAEFPWLVSLDKFSIWLHETVLEQSDGVKVRGLYFALFLGCLHYSPSLLEGHTDSLFEAGETMSTCKGHHITLGYLPWTPAIHQEQVQLSLVKQLEKWKEWRSYPYDRIKECLRPALWNMTRGKGSIYSYEEKGSVLRWTPEGIQEAIDGGTLSLDDSGSDESDETVEVSEIVRHMRRREALQKFADKVNRDWEREHEALQTLAAITSSSGPKVLDRCSALIQFPPTVDDTALNTRITREFAPEMYDLCYWLADAIQYRAALVTWRDSAGKKLWKRKVHRIVQPAEWHVTPSTSVTFHQSFKDVARSGRVPSQLEIACTSRSEYAEMRLKNDTAGRDRRDIARSSGDL